MHPEFLGQLVAQRRAQLEREAEDARLLGQSPPPSLRDDSRVRRVGQRITRGRSSERAARRRQRRPTSRQRAAERLLRRAARGRDSR